jgi:hypothetical protein
MFIIYGKKNAKIKSDTNHQHACQNCKDFDLDVKVYREYFHVCFIPLFPVGLKEVKIRCNNCGESKWIPALQQQYERTSRTPFYLYGLAIFMAAVTFACVGKDFIDGKNNAQFVADPHVGDVYTMRHVEKDSTFYYFLKVSQVKGDTISAYHNRLVYFSYVSKFDATDFFIKEEEYVYLKKDLKEMLDKEEINGVTREYGVSEGFNHVQ